MSDPICPTCKKAMERCAMGIRGYPAIPAWGCQKCHTLLTDGEYRALRIVGAARAYIEARKSGREGLSEFVQLDLLVAEWPFLERAQ